MDTFDVPHIVVDPYGLSDESGAEQSDLGKEKSKDILEEGDYEWDINPRLKLQRRICILEILRKRKICFTSPEKRLGKVKGYTMSIEADIPKIKSQAAYRHSPRKQKLIHEAIEQLKRDRCIWKSNSPITSPVVMVWQKDKARFCIDLQEVNSKTETDRYAIPCQDRIFLLLKGACYFAILDANKGYHQFEL